MSGSKTVLANLQAIARLRTARTSLANQRAEYAETGGGQAVLKALDVAIKRHDKAIAALTTPPVPGELQAARDEIASLEAQLKERGVDPDAI